MKAVFFRAHGGVDKLEYGDLPDPVPGAKDVRVRVKAVALNHLDIWVREGWPALKLKLPHILGSDVAGVVDAVGSEVTDLAVGTRVLVSPGLSCGSCRECLRGLDQNCRHYSILGEDVSGGNAELVCVPRQNILPLPERLSFEQGACLPLVFLTAHHMLFRRANLQPGETVLVHAAGSGVGSAAVQLAKLVGARVIATAGSDEKLEKAKKLGADELVNYDKQDFLAEVKRLTDKRGVDVVFEHTGEKTFDKSIRSLTTGGRLVTCGATTGWEAKFDIRLLFSRRISLLGATMGSKGDLFDVIRWVGEGKLQPVLDRTLPLAEARAAHEALKHREQFGKIVLLP